MTLIDGSKVRVNKGVCHFHVVSSLFKCYQYGQAILPKIYIGMMAWAI